MTVIGVTGHRHLARPQAISEGVDAVLDWIVRRFPPEPLTVVSALAEGADRLVAQRVLDRGGWLTAALPLPIPDYLEDFATADSRDEFLQMVRQATEVVELETAGSRVDAYLAASRYVVEHCDVLVAIWDGEEPQGPGGTGEIVTLARERPLPVAWIHVDHPEDPLLPEGGSEEAD